MKALKILFLSHNFYPDIGGIEVNSEILATQFVKAGHDVKLLTWTKEIGNRGFNFPVIRNPNAFQLFKLHLWADIIYENNPCLRMSWPAFFLNKKSVVALRTWISRAGGEISWQDKVKFYWLKRASGVIAVSNAVRNKTWSKAVVIGNPYRADIFKLKNVERNKDFVFLGRLVSQKGTDIALNALHKLNEGKEKYTLTIIGDGPDKKRLEQLSLQLNLNDCVCFTGTLEGEALINTLNSHKYLLVPSDWEAFGNIALEGIACGCLPFVSDSGGLPDAIGKAGVTFKNGDSNGLYKVIRDILNNPQKENAIRMESSKHLEKHLPEEVARRYLDVIQSSFY